MTLILGKNREPSKNFNDNANVVQSRDVRESGTALFGAAGSGKSSLIESMVYQDACNGEAIFVIDPHYDLINNIIAQLPAHRLKDTYLLDLTDKNYPFSCNFLDGSRMCDIDQASDWAETVFKKIFPAEGEQLLLNKVLRMLAFTMLSTSGSTIAQIPRLLKDSTYRAEFVARVTNRHVRDYWELDYDKMSPAKQGTEVYALNNRLPVLLTKPLIEYILAQPQSTVNFRKSIDAKEIILIRLPVDEYKEVAPIIGTVLIAELYRSAFSYTDTAPEKRPGFSVYIDEWHEFVADDIGRMFTSLRKFGCKLVVATQHRSKLKGLNHDSVMTANTVVALRLSPDDARSFAPLFLDRNKKPKLAKLYWDVLKRLSKHDSERVYRFSETVVKSILSIANDDDDSRCKDASLSQTLLEKLLLTSQKQGEIDEKLYKDFIRSMGWYAKYGDLEYYSSLAVGWGERAKKEFTVIEFLEKFEAFHLLKKYYYLMHYRYFYPSLDDPTAYVTCRDVQENKSFWEMVNDENNAIWHNKSEHDIRVDEFMKKQVAYHATLPRVTKRDELLDVYRQPIHQERYALRVQMRDIIVAMHTFKAQYGLFTKWIKMFHEQYAKYYQSAPIRSMYYFKEPMTVKVRQWYRLRYDEDREKLTNNQEINMLCPVTYELGLYHREDKKLYTGIPEKHREAFTLLIDQYCALVEKHMSYDGVIKNEGDLLKSLNWDSSDFNTYMSTLPERLRYTTLEKLQEVRDKEITQHLEKLRIEYRKTKEQYDSNYEKFKLRLARETELFTKLLPVIGDIVEQPIGEYEKPETTSDIATTLEQLPKRYALVKMGQEDESQAIFPLYSVDRPAGIGKDELKARTEEIRNRTRSTYCRTRAEIDAELNNTQAPVKPATQKDKKQPPLSLLDTDNAETSTQQPYALYGEVEE